MGNAANRALNSLDAIEISQIVGCPDSWAAAPVLLFGLLAGPRSDRRRRCPLMTAADLDRALLLLVGGVLAQHAGIRAAMRAGALGMLISTFG